MVLCSISAISCAKAKPVTPPPVPPSWNVPAMYRSCTVSGVTRWGPPKGGWTITLYCPEGLQLAGLQK
jgi:hypothetical protein